MEGEANGYYTRMIGERLERLIESEFAGLYRVHYDHKLVEPDRIIAYTSSGGYAENLAYLDIAIVSTQNNEEKILIISEIEEHKHSPKRFLGDIAAIMMAERIKVGGRDHLLANVVIVLGLVLKSSEPTGPRAERMVSRLESAIGEGEGGKRGIRCIVLSGENGTKLVEKVVAAIRGILALGGQIPC